MSQVTIARGKGRTLVASYTRPADTTQYTAGDVICDSTSAPTILTFRRASLDGFGIIQDAILTSSANVATKLDAELWLFDTTVAMDNDNAAFTPTDAEILTCVGIIPFASSSFKVGIATSGADGNAVCHITGLSIPFNNTGVTANDLFGILVARNAYVPVSGEVFQIRLKVLD